MTTATGGFRIIELGARITTDPDAASQEMLAAYTQAGYNALAASRMLGITYRTFWRYVDRLGIHKTLERLQTKAKKQGLIPQVRRRTK